jgi:hypothetical protein
MEQPHGIYRRQTMGTSQMKWNPEAYPDRLQSSKHRVGVNGAAVFAFIYILTRTLDVDNGPLDLILETFHLPHEPIPPCRD